MVYVVLAAACAASFLILSVSPSQNFPPPLSAAEEKELFEKFLSKNDSGARDKLIIHNQRLVAHLVRKYYAGQDNSEDLVSIGTIGLIKAIDSFKPESGVKFATYAARCIQNEILMYFRSLKKQSQEVSINGAVDVDKDGNPLTYIDIIKIDDTIADDLDRKERAAKAIYFIDNVLSPREKQIIRLRYGLGNRKPVTQREVSQMLGISRSYVSRIEKSALEKIHAHFMQ